MAEQNTITKTELFEALTPINTELRELKNGQKTIYWILGAILTIFVFFTILVITLLFDVSDSINTITREVGELQGLHSTNTTHTVVSQ